jgi:hypothetical protein
MLPSRGRRYDMRFDARYAYLAAVERLAELAGLNQPPPQTPLG